MSSVTRRTEQLRRVARKGASSSVRRNVACSWNRQTLGNGP